jgi:Mannosyltransferase (PIG-V)
MCSTVGVTVQKRRGQRARAAWASWRPDLAIAWRALWASRLLVWVSGLGAIAIWGVKRSHEQGFDPDGVTRPFGHVLDTLVAPAARWDASWYLDIAHHGYGESPNRPAFFPLYPMSIRAIAWVTGEPLLVGLFLSFLCFLVGLAAFHRLAALELGPDAARWAVWGLALFPGSLWFSAVYSESLFLMVSVGAVLCARQRRFAWAGVLGALGAATRSAGLVLMLPLALLWWDAYRAQRPPGAGAAERRVSPLSLGWVLLVPLGLAAYCGYLELDGASWHAPFAAQDVWHRAFKGPFVAINWGATAAFDGLRQIIHGSPTPVYWDRAAGDSIAVGRHDVALFLCLVLAVPALIGAFRRLPLAHGAYAAAALLLPLSYPVVPQPLMSLPRFEAVLYPLFLWLGWWLARGGVARRAIVLGVFAFFLAACSALFSTWHWVA